MNALAPYIVLTLFNLIFWGGVMHFSSLIFLARIQQEHHEFVHANANGRGRYARLSWFQRFGLIMLLSPWETKFLLAVLLPVIIIAGGKFAETLRVTGLLGEVVIEYYLSKH